MKKRQEINARENYWRKMILDWQVNGEQVNVFCKNHKITVSGFYSWRNRLFPELKIRQPKKPTVKSPHFVPVQLTQKIEEMRLHLPNGCWVNLKPDFDVTLLTKLICGLGGKDVNVTRC